MNVSAPRALEGVRIVEMGQLIAIPFAAKMLGDMGAEVIRIESCTRMDGYRIAGFYKNDGSGEFWNRAVNFYEQNRGKRSLTLDLTQSSGIETLIELIAVSDVFVENFTPRVINNFGLEYDDLRKVKPDIIMVSSTGYGHTGPWSGFGAIGYGTEAASGLAAVTGYTDGPPSIPELPYADYTAGEHTVFAIMAALMHRAATGEGQLIDVSQTQTLTATAPEPLMDYAFNGRVTGTSGNRDDRYAPQGTYRCDGEDSWLSLSVRSDDEWAALCMVLDRPDWVRDPRFGDGLSRVENHDLIDTLISEVTAGRSADELQGALQAAGVPAGAVLDGKALLFNEHLNARGFYEVVSHPDSSGMPPLPYAGRPWKFGETPGEIRSAAPTLGEHNRVVLSDLLGLDDARIADMRDSGVIGTKPANPRPSRQASNETLLAQGRIVRWEADFEEQVRRDQNAPVIEAVAIDGPVASGKTTVGARVAKRLGYAFLDTGLIYRAATWQAIRLGVDVGDEHALTRMAEAMRITLSRSDEGDRLEVDGVDVTGYLRSAEVDRNVSAVSAVRGVRSALTPQQRRIAEAGPIVMVGRDIGTVVLPDARIKVYLDASATVRAGRRYAEMAAAGVTADREQVLADTRRRDMIDSEREEAPLRATDDAVVIHTDDLSLAEVAARIVRLVERT